MIEFAIMQVKHTDLEFFSDFSIFHQSGLDDLFCKDT